MKSQFEENLNLSGSGSHEQDTVSSKAAPNAMATTMPSAFSEGLGNNNRNDSIVIEPKKKLLFSIALRLSNSDRKLLDRLSLDYAESLATIMSKSLRLYRGIVEAIEQGGSLLMIKNSSPSGRKPSMGSSDSYETIIAVREQFADKGKTPIALNRAYISASKGLKTERLAIRVNPAIAEGLADLESKTGLSKSDVLRDGIQLYNFVKREFEKPDTSFYIGDVPIKGI